MDPISASSGPGHLAQVRDEQIRIAFSQTMKGVIGGCLAALLFTWAFWDAAHRTVLLAWLGGLLAVSTLRVAYYLGYRGRRPGDATVRWERRFLFGTALHALAWGLAWWLFIPVAGAPEYTLVAALWLVGLSAASFSAYIVHLPSMMAFFLPVVVPGMVRIFLIGGRLEIAIALGLALYLAVVLSSMLPVHRAVAAAIRLNFENAREIAERKRAEEKLRELSIRDGLTGLATRRHFDEVLARELRRGQRADAQLSLLLIDVDCFKALNDSQGHIEGDLCLQHIAEVVKRTAKRPGDVAARYGGEEFALILPDTPRTQARDLGEQLRAEVEALGLSHPASRVEARVVTVSIGVATLAPTPASTAADLIQAADQALYRAKQNGRNRVEAATGPGRGPSTTTACAS